MMFWKNGHPGYTTYVIIFGIKSSRIGIHASNDGIKKALKYITLNMHLAYNK
jgi:hypothetical protein